MTIVLAGLVACHASLAIDPHAVGPEFDRWEARIPAPTDEVFLEVLHVLADSGYTARSADKKHGIIGTNLRRISLNGRTDDYRLDFMVLPRGDSTRVIIRGEVCHHYERSLQCHPRSALGLDWAIVQGIGEAVIARFR